MRAHGVDRVAHVRAPRAGRGDGRAEGARLLAQRRPRRRRPVADLDRPFGPAVGHGQKAWSGDGDDPGRGALLGEPQGDVDRRQAGAEEQDVVAGQRLERARRPGVGQIAGRVARPRAGGKRKVRRRGRPGGEHDPGGVDLAPARERHPEPAAGPADGDGVVAHGERRDGGAGDRIPQQGDEVAAEQRTAHERRALDGLALRRAPLHQVPGPAGQPAHPRRRHVHEVARVRGAVGDAATQPVGPLDDRHPHRPAGAQEVDGGERAGRTATDDRDVDGVGAGHGSGIRPAGAGSAMSRA